MTEGREFTPGMAIGALRVPGAAPAERRAREPGRQPCQLPTEPVELVDGSLSLEIGRPHRRDAIHVGQVAEVTGAQRGPLGDETGRIATLLAGQPLKEPALGPAPDQADRTCGHVEVVAQLVEDRGRAAPARLVPRGQGRCCGPPGPIGIGSRHGAEEAVLVAQSREVRDGGSHESGGAIGASPGECEPEVGQAQSDRLPPRRLDPVVDKTGEQHVEHPQNGAPLRPAAGAGGEGMALGRAPETGQGGADDLGQDMGQELRGEGMAEQGPGVSRTQAQTGAEVGQERALGVVLGEEPEHEAAILFVHEPAGRTPSPQAQELEGLPGVTVRLGADHRSTRHASRTRRTRSRARARTATAAARPRATRAMRSHRCRSTPRSAATGGRCSSDQ